MDSKLQPVQLYGFSKSRLYEPLGTAIFFRNRFCPVSWILVFLPVHFYGYSLKQVPPLCPPKGFYCPTFAPQKMLRYLEKYLENLGMLGVFL